MEVIRQIGRLFGYKNRQYETLTEVNTQGWKVRIWREAKSLEEAEQFARQMMRGARTGRREIELAGIGFGVGDQLG